VKNPLRTTAGVPRCARDDTLERSPDQHALVGVEERAGVAEGLDHTRGVALQELREALAEALLVIRQQRAPDPLDHVVRRRRR